VHDAQKHCKLQVFNSLSTPFLWFCIILRLCGSISDHVHSRLTLDSFTYTPHFALIIKHFEHTVRNVRVTGSIKKATLHTFLVEPVFVERTCFLAFMLPFAACVASKNENQRAYCSHEIHNYFVQFVLLKIAGCLLRRFLNIYNKRWEPLDVLTTLKSMSFETFKKKRWLTFRFAEKNSFESFSTKHEYTREYF